MKTKIYKLGFRIFMWLGNKFFAGKEVWIGGKSIKHQNYNHLSHTDIDVITFSRVKNWQRKTKRSKKYFGISTPKQT